LKILIETNLTTSYMIYLCILVEKYYKSKLSQNSRFSNVSTTAGRRKY